MPSKAYFNYQLDSRNWSHIELRHGDVIVATAPKVGSTWTLRLILTLIHGGELPAPVNMLAPWIDARFLPVPIEAVRAAFSEQDFRRVARSHLPFDALPFNPSVFYVCVGRDPRDVVLSLHNHYSSFTDPAIARLNAPPGTFAVEFARPGPDIHKFIREWLTQGNPCLPWEGDGFPSWSLFRQISSFWAYRELPNVLLVHYDDLLKDLAGEAARISRFLGIDATPERIGIIKQRCSFEAMRENGENDNPNLPAMLRGGARTFFNKGVSGRWKDVFTPEELELYHAAVARNLSPDCARWLEQGRIASGIDPSVV